MRSFAMHYRLVLTCLLVAGVSPVAAQVVQGPAALGQLPIPMMGPGQNLTPAQLQALMYTRALQSRGRHGVRTGYPQSIPMGNQNFGEGPVELVAPSTGTSTRTSSTDKKAFARQARDEQKRVADKNKKAKPAKKKPAPKAKPGKKEKADG